MFVADKDDANDATVCEQLDTASSAPVQIIKFKGVYHGYGDNIAPYNSHDWHMEYNAKADKETMDRTLSLIKSRSFQRGLEYK
jgi:dienelactone hydrolase